MKYSRTGWRASLTLAGVAVLAVVLAACGKPAGGAASGGKPAMPPAPVRVAKVAEQAVPVRSRAIGTVEACQIIAVRAQVTGEVTQVHFKEGDTIKKDQMLFSIDPRPYQVALAQAEAALAKARAQTDQARASASRSRIQADNARADLDRDTPLLPKRMISQEEFEKTKATAEGAKAGVSADEAATKSASESVRAAQATVDDAKLDLEYCAIKSPIDGRTGSVMVHAGNIVKANDSGAMVTINQISPIRVTFSIPEDEFPKLRAQMAKGPIEALALIPTEEDRPVKGVVSFVDNAVDRDTGTIKLKAQFANDDARLWPGQFVDVVLQTDLLPNAIVVPTQAVQAGQNGPYVYVAVPPKPDAEKAGGDKPAAAESAKPGLLDTVKGFFGGAKPAGADKPAADKAPGKDGPPLIAEMRPVETGPTTDGLIVVTKGVQADDTVITDGQVRVIPGARIAVIDDSKAAKKEGASSPDKPGDGKPSDAGKAADGADKAATGKPQ